MTRKDYIKTAYILCANLTPISDPTGTLTNIYESLCTDFADMFADDNPAFDRDRFMRACGQEGYTIRSTT